MAIAWVGVELLCAAAFFAVRDGGFSHAALAAIRAERMADLQEGQIARPGLEVIHPYLGYVYDPAGNSGEMTAHHGGVPISEFGFLDHASPLRAKADDEVVVGLFGGSFAFFFSVHGLEAMLDGLRAVPRFRGKEISVVRVALGGYKQPQQLLALSYLLALGARFDAVINLDGFNEVALPAAENLPTGVFPFFPRNWSARVASAPGLDEQAAMLRIADLRRKRLEWSTSFEASLFRMSVAANLYWWLRDARFADLMTLAQIELAHRKSRVERFEASGPPRVYTGDDALYADLAAVWFNSSLEMHRLCAAYGIRYWHFLQPNQYVEASKPMGKAERAVAFQAPQFYRNQVEAGYPVLRRRGADLAAAGVAFHDLTGVYRTHTEPLYIDSCCHVNERGYEIIGAEMARWIRAEAPAPDHGTRGPAVTPQQPAP
ncbi:MAG: hypothetical protein ACE5FL_05495 [Myxococcota bacterium]